VLTTILNSAVKDALIAANPALGADKPALSDGPVKVGNQNTSAPF
jgi:hypothetical protein